MRKPARQKCERQDDRQAGFTLVELLVVLVILSMISGIVAPRVLNYLTDARARTSELQINALKASLDLFFLDVGRYPTEGEGLQALMQGDGIRNWSGPLYSAGATSRDPLGNAYAYRVDGTGYRLISFGSDGPGGGGR
jgi:general secretion pathway protein G